MSLTDSQRTSVRHLIARLGNLGETEEQTVARLIPLTEHDIVRFRGERTTSGVPLDALAEKRLAWLTAYQREITEARTP